jgi:hypothetical protein
MFVGLGYMDIVQMDDEALEKKGVSALGARRKMLKVFEIVKQYLKENEKEKA